MFLFSHFRSALHTIFGLSFMGTIFSLLTQYAFKMNPCVMCIQQRISLLFIALLSIPCLFLSLSKSINRSLSAIILSIPTAFGGFIAAKQIWLQSLPISQQPDCGAPWTFRLRGTPLFDWYEPLIRGTGVCGEVHRIFGITLPVWSLLFFITIWLILWITWWNTRQNRRI